MDIRRKEAMPHGRWTSTMARGSDRFEAAVLAFVLLLGLATAGAGGFLGVVTAREMAAGHVPHAGEYLTLGTMTTVGLAGPSAATAPGPLNVDLSWTGRDGRTHSGTVVLGRRPSLGEPVGIVVDALGRPRSQEPISSPTGTGVALGVVVALAGWMLLAYGWQGFQRLMMRRNIARWAAEWEKVGPTWSKSST